MNKLIALLLAFCTLTTWAQPDGKPNPFQDPRFCMTFGKTFMEEKCCPAPPPKLFDGPELAQCKAEHSEASPAGKGSRKSRAAKPDTSSFPTTCAIDCFFKQSSFYTADSKIDGDKIVAYFNSKTEVSEDIRNIFIAGVPKCLTGANAMQQIPHTCNTEAQFFSMCLYLQYLLSCPSFADSKPQCTAAKKGLSNCDPFYFPTAAQPSAAAGESPVKHRAHKGRNGGRSGAGRKGGGRNGKKNTQTP